MSDNVPEEVKEQLYRKLTDLSFDRLESHLVDGGLGEIDWQVLRTLERKAAYEQWLYQFTTCWPDIRTFSN